MTNDIINYQSISHNIRKIRLTKNLSIIQMANKLGITRQAYDKIERAKTKLTLENAVKLSQIFEISLDNLLLLSFSSTPQLNEIVFPSFKENEDGSIVEYKDIKLNNFIKSIYVFENKERKTTFFESTVSPCYGNTMIFYHGKKIVCSKIYQFLNNSICYIKENKMVKASLDDIHFLAVEINIFDYLK